MGLFDIFFESSDKKMVRKYRKLEDSLFCLRINNLSDKDIVWINDNVEKSFDFSDFPDDIKIKPISNELLFVVTCELLEIYNCNNKESYDNFLKLFIEAYLNKKDIGLKQSLSDKAISRLSMLLNKL